MTYRFPQPPAAVLFDLDGTLVDSAPDLAGAVNALRVRRRLPELPLAQLRPYSSLGARGLIGAGLGVTPEHVEFDALRDEFLSHYESHSCVHTALFEGMGVVLDWLGTHGIPWGIVTNKHARFTIPLVQALGLDGRAAVVVSGDTTEHAKPHPQPLLYAAHQLGLPTNRLVYVGDDLRDIQSARSAGFMSALAAAYGYCEGDDVLAWQADDVLISPAALLDLLKDASR